MFNEHFEISCIFALRQSNAFVIYWHFIVPNRKRIKQMGNLKIHSLYEHTRPEGFPAPEISKHIMRGRSKVIYVRVPLFTFYLQSLEANKKKKI